MDDQPQPADIVELGKERSRLPRLPRLPGWPPSRGAGVFAVAALAAGLTVGYAAGDQHVLPLPQKINLPAAPSEPAPTRTFALADSEALSQDTACSAQTGQDLQLGVQLTNQSATPLVLQSARFVLPLGGLKQVTWQWATCGALPGGPGQAEEILASGQSTWLTATFKVQVRCPTALPVQFGVGYTIQGHSSTTTLPGFPDLSQVTYSGCPATADSTSGGELGPTSRWRELPGS